MKLLKLTPMLTVPDIEQAIDFYVQKLGFEKTALSEEGGWGEVQRDGIAVMFAKPNQHMPWDEPKMTGSLYLVTDDVDAIWNKVKDDLKICYPLDEFPYGMKEFAVFDNNGYLIQFGQEIE